MSQKISIIIAVLVIIAAGVVFGYGYFKLSTKTAPAVVNTDIQTPEATISQPSEQTAGQTKVIKIIASQWKFMPGTIRVNFGDDIELRITSIDVPHGFAVSEFNINETIRPGGETVINFKADKRGVFDFFCSIPCGSGHGQMTGQLIVE